MILLDIDSLLAGHQAATAVVDTLTSQNGLEEFRFLGIKLINVEDFFELLIRSCVNFLVTFVIVRVIYYNIYKKKDYLFTYMLFNLLIFFLCFLMNSVKLSIGFAFGLFAVFSILRYRTLPISIRDMTYLFIIIGVAVFNAISTKKVSYAELAFTNLAIIGFTYALEKLFLLKNESRKTVDYEKIELIKPENEEALIADLRERTGLPIHRVEVGRIDFLRDVARIRVYFYENVSHED